MNNISKNYIDNLIRDNADKSEINYELDVYDLALKSRKDAMNFLFTHDTNFKDIVEQTIDEYIYERIGTVQSEDYAEKGLLPRRDPVNGEIIWDRRA